MYSPIKQTYPGLTGIYGNANVAQTLRSLSPVPYSTPNAFSSGGLTSKLPPPGAIGSKPGGGYLFPKPEVLGLAGENTVKNPVSTRTTTTNTQPVSTNSGIDNVFDETLRILGERENDVNSQKNQYISRYSGAYDPYFGQINQARDLNRTTGLQNQEQARIAGQNSLNNARRQTNELSQGIQQRFGGSSSTGEFANAFLGREFQRQAGGIEQGTTNTILGLQQKQQEIDLGLQQQINDLNVKKTQLLAQIEQEFNQRLSDISNLKGQTQQAKAQAKYEELVNLRNRANSVNSYFDNLGQQIEAQNEQARQSIASQIAAAQAAAGQPVDLSGIPDYLKPSYVTGANSPTSQFLQGQISNKRLQDKNLYQ